MARMAVRNALFLGKGRMSALLVPWTTFTQVGCTPSLQPACSHATVTYCPDLCVAFLCAVQCVLADFDLM